MSETIKTPVEPATAPPADAPKSEVEASPAEPTTKAEEPPAPETKPEETPAPAPTDATAPVEGSESKSEPASSGPTWPAIDDDHPISLLLKELPGILEESEYNEVYGIHLDASGPFHTKLILQKFLRGNANDVEKAKAQLAGALKWRKEFQPLKALEETFSREKFGGLGFVIELEDVPGSANKKDFATFNIYGAVKDKKKTFGDLDE